MWSLPLDFFKTSFAQVVEFGEKSQLATHNLLWTQQEVALSRRLSLLDRCPKESPPHLLSLVLHGPQDIDWAP